MRLDRILLIISIVVIATAFFFLLFPQSGKASKGLSAIFSNIHLGLDIKGGSVLEFAMATEDENVDENQLANDVIAVLRNRLDSVGYTEATIKKVFAGNKVRIRVEIPEISDPSKAERLLGKKGKLYFSEVLDSKVQEEKPTEKPFKYQDAVWLKNISAQRYYNETEWLLVREDIRIGAKIVNLDGSKVKDARASFDPKEGYVILLTFNNTGRKLFADITRAMINKRLAIILDNNVLVAPVVKEAIPGGQARITGKFSIEEAREIATLIKSGNLPVDLIKVEENSVGPLLGKDIILQSLVAGIIGLIVVMVYMIVVYGWMGVVADIALVYNTFLLFGVLALTRSILTLPGIAGIILTIGTTVDGNIIIFERIKEEMRLGKTVHNSIAGGFSKATSTIVDANLTTILAGVALYLLGKGTIKGFATTLIIGVIGSMFTVLVVSRVILDLTSTLIKNKYSKALGTNEGVAK